MANVVYKYSEIIQEIGTKVYKFFGDAKKAMLKRGLGDAQLGILKQQMYLGGLQQGTRQLSYADGSVVACKSVLGADTVEIYVPPFIPAAERKKIALPGQPKAFFRIQVFRDDDVTVPYGIPGAPVFDVLSDWYWFSLSISDEDGEDIADVFFEDDEEESIESFYKRNADGSRKKDADGNDVSVWNPTLKCWEFDSYIWNANEPAHPTKPPEGSTPALVWDGALGKYVATKTKYVIRANCRNGVGSYYRKLTPGQLDAGEWPRDLGGLVAEDRRVSTGDYVIAIPYAEFSNSYSPPQSDYITKALLEITTNPEVDEPVIAAYFASGPLKSLFLYGGADLWLYVTSNNIFSNTLIVKSSIPYSVSESVWTQYTGPDIFMSIKDQSILAVRKYKYTGLYEAAMNAVGTKLNTTINSKDPNTAVVEVFNVVSSSVAGEAYPVSLTLANGSAYATIGVVDSNPFVLHISVDGYYNDNTYKFSLWHLGEESPKWWKP